MIKKVILLLTACAIISCKNNQTDTVLESTGVIKTDRLIEDFTCKQKTYIFQIPFYQGSTEIENRLNKDLKNLITQDFIDVTYNKDADLKEIWELFMNERERKICAGNKNGINNISIEHISQNDSILSYEIVYSRDNKNKRLTKTFKKPGLIELKINDLAKSGKEDDVRRIFDINLQQSVANMSLEIKPEDYNGFRDFLESKAFNFTKEEFESATMAIHIASPDSLILQMSKKIELPSKYSYLNEDVKVEIRAQEMDYYLNLAALKI